MEELEPGQLINKKNETNLAEPEDTELILSKLPMKEEKKGSSKLKRQTTSKDSKEVYNAAGEGPKSMQSNRTVSFNVVSRWYRSPEVILMQPYTSSIDLWSFGCIVA